MSFCCSAAAGSSVQQCYQNMCNVMYSNIYFVVYVSVCSRSKTIQGEDCRDYQITGAGGGNSNCRAVGVCYGICSFIEVKSIANINYE